MKKFGTAVAILAVLVAGCVPQTGGLTVAQSPEITSQTVQAPLIDADIGIIHVDVSSPERSVPTSWGEPWMYYNLLNDFSYGWNVNVATPVEQSVRQSGIFTPGASRKLRLDAELVEMIDSSNGYDMDLNFGMRYRLTDPEGEVVFDREIVTKGIATVGEYFVGADRVVAGTERALKANLVEFLRYLRSDIPAYLAAKEQERVLMANVRQQLTRENAVYRVVAGEALIRTLPDANAKILDRIGQGGLVDITGSLPDGWMQAAREGKPIGWVYSSALAPEGTRTVAGNRVGGKVEFPSQPLNVAFAKGGEHPDDIAVIIGNADYSNAGKDIPDVVPAYADAEGFKRYAIQALGIRPGNVIDLRDATQAEFISVFGTPSDHKGRLYNWVRPKQSRVVIYFAGHGAPGQDGTAYLVPSDADPAALHLNGYRLDHLYANLSKVRAKSVLVVLEACFSGASADGSVISNASPVFMKTKPVSIPDGLTVISAGSGRQIASWEEDKSHGLFTKYFLLGMAGEADKKPTGNADGKVSFAELSAYLDQTVTYYARRYYGRDQQVQLVGSRAF
ncbi:caspase family protein [Aestuariispira insulae]|uniref:Caspase domain-containing protein n=1 Tax=Aestuariispira insulae TaxID=1461337 RepID=A0A3D9HVW9_9PROT|nr:caspase family protein [Aestuariispira insulae]RED53654.1 caspase domain-containing protein [Aestuariispira insulae]